MEKLAQSLIALGLDARLLEGPDGSERLAQQAQKQRSKQLDKALRARLKDKGRA